jgi:competence protein ComEA
MAQTTRLAAERAAPAAERARLAGERPHGVGSDSASTRRVVRAGEPLALGALDPDRATAADWERLPGIGPALAARIVADRGAHGPFGGVAGLARVRGNGPKTVERLRPYLRDPAVDSVPPNAN